MELTIGHGYDIHRLVEGKALILGGQHINYHLGLLGHSDGDVVCHAIIDALLGAASLPDIGQTFPDHDPQFLNADSCNLLHIVWETMLCPKGYCLGNIDATIIAQAPVLFKHIPSMSTRLASILNADPSQVHLKAKTHEGLDSVGQGKAIACHAVCLLFHEKS